MSPLMDRSFEGKVAVVTGAASGMGLVTARSFAEAGAAVTLADIDERAARTAVDDLIAAGRWRSLDGWMPPSITPAYRVPRSKRRMPAARNSIA